MTGQAWIRLRDARPLVEWLIKDAILQMHYPGTVVKEAASAGRVAAAMTPGVKM
jgi:hypothetical protein